MNCQEFGKILKDGDTLTISNNPRYWSSACGGNPGTRSVNFPYTFKVEKFHIHPDRSISIKDTEGYGWAINTNTSMFFKLENGRKDRIKNLNL